MLRAQVTNGKKPQLPAPYATKSAGNAPNKTAPPAGFLPAVPSGFRVNIFAANFKVPRRVLFLDALPMTATGKVQKFALRERAAVDLGLHAVKTA